MKLSSNFFQLFLCMVIGIACVQTANAHDFCSGGIYYTITNSSSKTVGVTYEGTSYSAYSNEYSGSVTVPSTVYYNGTTYSVTSIQSNAFRNCTGLASITIPSTITDVYGPFAGCTGLKTVILSDSESTDVTIFHALLPTETDEDGDYDLSYEKAVFADCNIQNFYIGHPFESKKHYYYYWYGANLSQFTGALFEDNQSINRVEYGTKLSKPISKSNFTKSGYYSGTANVSIENLYIPSVEFWCNLHSDFSEYNIMGITKNLYVDDVKTQDIVIPKSVTTLGTYTFTNASFIQSVTLPVYLTSIGSSCFNGCTNLNTVYNNSSLSISRGESSNGYVAYYAQYVLNSGDVLDGDFVWNTSNGHVLTGYAGTGGELTLPTNHNGYNYSIGQKAFKGLASITSIDMSKASITSIGASAFQGCNAITSVKLPTSSLTSIGESAFESCSKVTSVSIPSSVTSIGNNAFKNSGLVNCKIPASVTSIGSSVFYGCTALTSATLGSGITTIPDYSFHGCSSLTSITIPLNIKSIGSYAFKNSGLASCSIPSTVSYIGTNIFEGCSKLVSVTLSTAITEIPASAFTNCSALASISIPSAVKTIGNLAFYSSGLTSVSIPATVTSIGSGAFQNCTKLTKATILSNTTSLPSYIFYYCKSLETVSLSNTISSLGEYGFYDCDRLKTVNVPNSVTIIPNYCFYCCDSLQSITLPDALQTISGCSFYNCKSLSSITLPQNLSSIGSSAFYNCQRLKIIYNKSSLTIKKGNSDNGLVAYYASAVNPVAVGDFMFDENDELVGYTGNSQNVTLPDTYNNKSYGIGRYGLSSINAKNLTLSDGVTYISDYAFYGCNSLETVTIPKGITSISGYYSFAKCPKLKTIYYNAVNPTITSNSCCFSESGANLEIIVGSDVQKIPSIFNYSVIYKVNFENSSFTSLPYSNLSAYVREMVLGNLMTTIPSDFTKFSDLKDLTIPKSITSIQSNAFKGCTSLDTIRVADMDSWLSMKFANTLSNPLTHAHNIYIGGKLLEDLVIPSTVTIVGSERFKNLTCLKSIEWENNLCTIENGAFSGTKNVKKIICKTVTPPACSQSEFQDIWRSCTLYVPQKSYDTYSRILPWSQFLNIEKLSSTGGEEVTEEDTDLSQYPNVVYIEGTEGNIGSTITLSLNMNNTIAPTGFQCDVYLPTGVEVAKDDDGFYLASLSTARTTAQKTNYFDSALQPDGSIRIMCNSTKNYTFSGNEGKVATIPVKIADTVEEGEYPLILKNIVISDASSQTYEVDYEKTTLTVSSYTLGDANSDGKINVGDFTAIASDIMGNPPAAFVEKAADVNVDGKINVGDLTGVANLILYGTVTLPSSAREAVNANVDANVNLNVLCTGGKASIAGADADCQTVAGNEFTIAVDINGDYAFSGYQFDMSLPDGISVKMNDAEPCAWLSNARTNARRTDFFTSEVVGDNTLRVLSASSKGYTFEGTEGTVAFVTLVADKDVAEGDYIVGINNIVVSANGDTQIPTDAQFVVHVGSTTGIADITSDDGNKTVYDLSGKVVNTSSSLDGLHKGIYIMNGKKIVK